MSSSSTDYASTITLLPTIEFLEYVNAQQMRDLEIGFSPIIPQFFSSTNSEWLCLDSSSEFLKSPTQKIKIDSSKTELINDQALYLFSADGKTIKKTAKSAFLCRSTGTQKEVLLIGNFTPNGKNQTTAPPLDGFSRQCLSWFSSEVDYFIGFGSIATSLQLIEHEGDAIATSKSEDILEGLIPQSTQPCPYTSIQVVNAVSTNSPYVTIQFSTGVEYIATESTPSFNVMFLFTVEDDDSLVSFAHYFTSPQSVITYDKIKTTVHWDTQKVIII